MYVWQQLAGSLQHFEEARARQGSLKSTLVRGGLLRRSEDRSLLGPDEKL